jgi:hypothetical protein
MSRKQDPLLTALLVRLLRDAVATIEAHEDPDDEAWIGQARHAINLATPKCDTGLFGDNHQMDLADRQDLKR